MELDTSDLTGEILCALEVGSSRATAAIGRLQNGEIRLLGVGTAERAGLLDGYSFNLDEVTDAVSEAYRDARTVAGVDSADTFWMGLPSNFVRTVTFKQTVELDRRTVTAADLMQALAAAREELASPVYAVLHQPVSRCQVDGRDYFDDVIGRRGRQLVVEGHLLMAAEKAVQMLEKACHGAGITLNGMMLDVMAACCATVSERQRKDGVCVVDLGHRSTSIGIWAHGHLQHVGILHVGGETIARKVAETLETTVEESRSLIQRYGSAQAERVPSGDMFDVRPMDADSVRYPRRYLAHILEPIFQELFKSIIQYVERAVPLASLDSGIVLTGGLASLDGLMGMAAQTFGERRLMVQPGVPGGVTGLADMVCEPRFATTVGLMIEASVPDRTRSFYYRNETNLTETITARIRTFFERMF